MAPSSSEDDAPEAKRRRRQSKWDHDDAAAGGATALAAAQSSASAAMQQHQSAAAFNRLAVAAAARQTDIPRPRVYVGNLHPMVSEHEILQIFNAFGVVAGIDLPREGTPPQSRGFCFVEFLEQRMADLAIASLQDFMLAGRKLRVGRPTSQKRVASAGILPAQVLPAASPGLGAPGPGAGGVGAPAAAAAAPGAPAMQSLEAWRRANGCHAGPSEVRILLLENLVPPGEADEDLAEEVKEECGRFGAVHEVKIHEVVKDRRVRAFVKFKDLEAGGRAMAALHGRFFGGRQVRAMPYSEELFASGELEMAGG